MSPSFKHLDSNQYVSLFHLYIRRNYNTIDPTLLDELFSAYPVILMDSINML
jgi:hypothetical protein